MKPLVVIEVPGLTRPDVEAHAPGLASLGKDGHLGTLDPILPAVTMPVHSTLMTGSLPSEHGVVANGWFERGQNEVRMWQQSGRLVQGERVWEAGKKRNPDFKCLKYFWWPGMASTADIYGNVRPIYYVDGRKGPDIYMNQPGLAEEIQSRFGTFPLFKFWGPGVDITSTRWIANTARYLFDKEQPTLSLIYLPHLDYRQQIHGPQHESIAEEVKALDELMTPHLEHFRSKGAEILILSGYHMNQVDTPIHLNRSLREQGWLKVVRNAAGELIDYGTSQAFALADHQLAHIYVRNEQIRTAVREHLSSIEGIDEILGGEALTAAGLAHANSGDLVVTAKPNAWFTYYYWQDDSAAPDFARTVAIHDKPGYDPCEMILDPSIAFPKLKVGWLLARKTLGFRYNMNVIPLDASLVKGSHGLKPTDENSAPVFIASHAMDEMPGCVPMVEVKKIMLKMIFGE
jgi:predicted AlkP superfamily pyrophosphatase or phosphodiesterase